MAVRSWLVENYNSDAGNGGPGPQLTVVGGKEGFAGMQAPDRTLQGVMVDVYGTEEAQQIFDQFTSTFTGWERAVLAVRRDLSVLPN